MKINKSSELVAYVKAWVDSEYESGRVTVLTDDELLAIIKSGCDKLGIILEMHKMTQKAEAKSENA